MTNVINQKKSQYTVREKRLFEPASKTPFPLSRSKIEDFLSCPRCFYMDRRLGIAKPDTPPFQLNKAVDELLKKEFDQYRAKQEPHPFMTQHSIDAIPFAHRDLAEWRENFKGVRFHHSGTNFIVFGAIDDVWVKPDGELILLDYKATWSTKEATLDSEYRQAWKHQLEIYQWLFRKKGFRVANKGYFIYCNAIVGPDGFNGCLKFDLSLLDYEADDSWVEATLFKIRDCLTSNDIPRPAEACHYCAYRKASALAARK